MGGKVKTDLLIGSLAIELEAKGVFDSTVFHRYANYKAAAATKGYSYLYVALQETHKPYREGMQLQLGAENAFFLDIPGDERTRQGHGVQD